LYRNLGYRNEALFRADVSVKRLRTLRALPLHRKKATSGNIQAERQEDTGICMSEVSALQLSFIEG